MTTTTDSIKLDMSKRAFDELWICEVDTASDESPDGHIHFAEQMEASTSLPNGKHRVLLTAETLVYLAENLHYQIDRCGDLMSQENPKYDFQSWSDAGATLSSLKGLDVRVKNMCAKLGLRYKVWSFTKGMHYRDAD